MTTESAEEVLSDYVDALRHQGMHPISINAYARLLGGFFAVHPDVLELDERQSREVITSYLASRESAYDDYIVQAALRKWHWLKFGVVIGKHRDSPGDFRYGPDIEAEISALRIRLEEDRLSATTIDSTCRATAMFLGWVFPDHPVDIETIDGFTVINFLTQRKTHLSIGGMKTEATRLKRYIKFVDERLNRHSTKLPLSPPTWGNSPLPRSVGDDEYELLTAIDGSSRSYAVSAAAALMGNLGLRCCEVASLTLDDIDFRNAMILVRATKGEDDRRIPLDRETGEAVARYIMQSRPATEHRNLFIRAKSHKGEPMTKSQLRGLMRYQARIAGVPDFGTHMLRRRSASKMVQSGVSLKVVADIMGHQEVQTTKTYLRIDVEHLRIAAGEWPGDARG